MGSLLIWERPTTETRYENVEIFRSASASGQYNKIHSQPIDNTSFYDCDDTEQYYKIRFYANEEFSDFSEYIFAEDKYLYCSPEEALETAGLSYETLPNTITNDTLFNWIYDISKDIERMTGSVYGRTEPFSEITSSNYINFNQTYQTEARDIISANLFLRRSIVNKNDWFQSTEGFDYEFQPNGVFHIFRFPLTPRGLNDIKIEGTHGLLDIPPEINQLTKYLVAIRIFVHVTGGTYNDVTSYTLGEYSESLGEPYVNIREGIKIIEQDLKRIFKLTGISATKVSFRIR